MKKSNDLKIIVFGLTGFAAEVIEKIFSQNLKLVAVVCKKPRYPLLQNFKSLWTSCVRRAKGSSSSFIYRDAFSPWKNPYEIALTHHIPILPDNQIQLTTFAEKLKSFQPDIILVAGFSKKIPKNVIQIPSKAIINLHPSLLPKYRGGTPIRWAKFRGEKKNGLTAHIISEKIDGGNIILQKRIVTSSSDTSGDIERKMAKLAGEMSIYIVKNLKRLLINQRRQSEQKATYDPPLHGKYQYIKWNQAGKKIINFINSMKPKSGGICFYEGKKVCIYEISFFKKKNRQRQGKIVRCDRTKKIFVKCKDGIIEILSFLKDGKIVPARKVFESECKVNISK